MVSIAFYDASQGTYLDKLVAWWTRGLFSHCEIYFSKFDICCSASPREGMVRFKKIDDLFTSGKWTILSTEADEDWAYKFCKEHEGQKYDWLAIICCQFLPFGEQARNKWFCSELAARIKGYIHAAWYSPNRLYSAMMKEPETKQVLSK